MMKEVTQIIIIISAFLALIVALVAGTVTDAVLNVAVNAVFNSFEPIVESSGNSVFLDQFSSIKAIVVGFITIISALGIIELFQKFGNSFRWN